MLYHAGSCSLVLYARAFSLTCFEAYSSLLRLNKAFRFFIFAKREKERDLLDLPLVADVEPSIKGDFANRELTRTDFDSLHAGLALFDLSRVLLLLLTMAMVLVVDVIAALMNFRVRIFIGVGRSQSGGR